MARTDKSRRLAHDEQVMAWLAEYRAGLRPWPGMKALARELGMQKQALSYWLRINQFVRPADATRR